METSGWPRELYENKIDATLKLLKSLEDLGILTDIVVHNAFFVAVPRAYFSPKRIVTEVSSEIGFRGKALLDETVINGIKGIIFKMLEEARVTVAGSRLILMVSGKFVDEPVNGSIFIRGTGKERREYGDVELLLYAGEGKSNLVYLPEMYSQLIRDGFSDLVKKFERLFIEFLYHRDSWRVREVFLMEYEGSVKSGYNVIYAVGHRAFESHITLLKRYMNLRRRKYRHEDEMYKKLASIYNYSTLLNTLKSGKYRHVVEKAFSKVYSKQDFEVSRGSYIVITRSGESLGGAYSEILEEVIKPLLDSFPGWREYSAWLEKGISSLRRRIGG